MKSMYCSQCGKRIVETMLFCPFCGKPVVIPEQDVQERAAVPAEKQEVPAAVQETSAPAAKPAAVQPELIEIPEAPAEQKDEQFIPLDVTAAIEQAEAPKEDPSLEEPPRDVALEVSALLASQLRQEPVHLQGKKPDLSAARQAGAPKIASARKNKDTYVPPRKFDPGDMFLDSDDDVDPDRYDEDYEEYESDDYEDAEDGGFFVRHIRGLVALTLLMVVAAVLVVWAFSYNGQQSLARAGLAWRPSAYAEIAYDAYQSGNYLTAGRYYEKAVERDPLNYEHVSSASVSFFMAQDMTNAEKMARKAVEIDPSRMNAYEVLLRLYPDAATRPLEIQAIFQKGYQLTGDARMNSAQ